MTAIRFASLAAAILSFAVHADVAEAAPGSQIAAGSRSHIAALIEKQKITSDDGATDDQFGWCIAINGDIALVGAPNATIGGDIGRGAVYVFERSGDEWLQADKLTADDGREGDSFGLAVAFSGSTAIIGAPNTDTFRGAAYVFHFAHGTWTQSQKLTASDGTEFNQFGWSVALGRTTVLIGSTSATVGGNSSQGAVYAFDDAGGTWIESQKFSSSDGVTGDAVGWSIALDGRTAIVGANFATVRGNEFQGAAYAFTRRNNLWMQTQKLTASNGDEFDFFGSAVAIEKGTVLVGAEGAATDHNPFSSQGVVYRFSRSTVGWNQTQILAASDGEASDGFGHSVTLSHGTALIGATGVNVDGVNSAGAAYVFQTTGQAFVEADKLTASDPVELASYGWSGAIFGSTLLVGAYTTTAGGHERQGAVYAYAPAQTP